jgi:hypothetical protein
MPFGIGIGFPAAGVQALTKTDPDSEIFPLRGRLIRDPASLFMKET